MFKCPRCNEALARCQTKGGVLWRCARCEGRTATVAMLRQSVNQDLIATIWEQVQGEFAADSLPCPACRASMKAAWLPASSGNCQIDICPRCHVAWFDKDEFDRVPTAAGDSRMYRKDIPLEARLAMARLHVEALDPRPDMKIDTAPPAEDWKAIPAFFGMPVRQEASAGLLGAKATLSIAISAAGIGLLALYIAPRMLQDFGFIPARAGRLSYLTAFTSLLLYGSLPHLATSIYFLLTFGNDVEDLLGTPRFLILLLTSAICGITIHTMLHPQSTAPLLGFGPAVSGLLAAFGLRFPHAKIGFVFRLPVVVYRWVNLPAWGYILFWIITQTIGAAIPEEGIEQVSWSAHLGGAIAGGILGIFLAKPSQQSAAA